MNKNILVDVSKRDFKNVKDIKDGDIFVYKNMIKVSAENYSGGNCLFLTNPEFYIFPDQPYVYGYTNGCIEPINENETVRYLGNILNIKGYNKI